MAVEPASSIATEVQPGVFRVDVRPHKLREAANTILHEFNPEGAASDRRRACIVLSLKDYGSFLDNEGSALLALKRSLAHRGYGLAVIDVEGYTLREFRVSTLDVILPPQPDMETAVRAARGRGMM